MTTTVLTPMRRWRGVTWALGRTLAAGLALSGAAAAGPEAVPEYQLRALYLYNFASFVTWPPVQGAPPFRYCLVEAGPVEHALAALMRGEAVKGRPLEIRRLTGEGPLPDCQVIYLGEAGAGPPGLLAAVAGRPVLTVGDSEDFLQRGGMIALVRHRLKVKIMIALDPVRHSGLRINARLLQLATLVRQAPGAAP
jgi:YfiR/HmsC-like